MKVEKDRRFTNVIGVTDIDSFTGEEFAAGTLDNVTKFPEPGEHFVVGPAIYEYVGDDNLGNSHFRKVRDIAWQVSVVALWDKFLEKVARQDVTKRWWGCGTMPTKEEIETAVTLGKFQDLPNDYGHPDHRGERQWHIERVAFLFQCRSTTPLRMHPPISDLHLYDGAHRLLAALYRGDTKIWVRELKDGEK